MPKEKRAIKEIIGDLKTILLELQRKESEKDTFLTLEQLIKLVPPELIHEQDRHGYTILHCVLCTDLIDIKQFAYEFKMPVEVALRLLASKEALATQDRYGDTPLHYVVSHFAAIKKIADAANMSGEAVLRLLASKEALATQDRYGDTPFHYVVSHLAAIKKIADAANMSGDAVLRLLASKEALATQDNDGRTPLHCVIIRPVVISNRTGMSGEMVLRLLATKEALATRDNDGWTPLYVAVVSTTLTVELAEEIQMSPKEIIMTLMPFDFCVHNQASGDWQITAGHLSHDYVEKLGEILGKDEESWNGQRCREWLIGLYKEKKERCIKRFLSAKAALLSQILRLGAASKEIYVDNDGEGNFFWTDKNPKLSSGESKAEAEKKSDIKSGDKDAIAEKADASADEDNVLGRFPQEDFTFDMLKYLLPTHSFFTPPKTAEQEYRGHTAGVMSAWRISKFLESAAAQGKTAAAPEPSAELPGKRMAS